MHYVNVLIISPCSLEFHLLGPNGIGRYRFCERNSDRDKAIIKNAETASDGEAVSIVQNQSTLSTHKKGSHGDRGSTKHPGF